MDRGLQDTLTLSQNINASNAYQLQWVNGDFTVKKPDRHQVSVDQVIKINFTSGGIGGHRVLPDKMY